MTQDSRVSIHIQGQDRTHQIKDWAIRWSEPRQALVLTCQFHSDKSFTSLLSDCCIAPCTEMDRPMLFKQGSATVSALDKAVVHGGKYAVVHYPGSAKPYVFRLDGKVTLQPRSPMKDSDVFRYFVSVAQARAEQASSPEQQQIAANVVKQLDKLPPVADSALHAYCTGQLAPTVPVGPLIYPFGVNASQLVAVERALGSQVSVIEGPPGTGKTQTILNIIANVLVRGQSVAVVSNNNAAVQNVVEKLDKAGLGHVAARLGSKELREKFFADLPAAPTGEPDLAPTLEELQGTLTQLKGQLEAFNAAARWQAELDEVAIEQRHLLQWQQDNPANRLPSLDRYGLSASQAVDLMAYLSHLRGRSIRLRDRFALFRQFRILRTRPFGDASRRQAFVRALQRRFYDQSLRDKEAALAECRATLSRGDFHVLLETLTTGSMRRLKRHLHDHLRAGEVFDATTYRRNFDGFLRRFPVLCSGTHSIVNSIAPGALLDCVIIDEASLQDIVPGILALGCAKHIVIVGDRRQLPHIPLRLGMTAPADAWDCEKHSLLDSCLAVFRGTVPVTLLKEHYRCHPRIIQFCNQQFYDNELIPMTRDKGEQALRLVVTAKGNHARRTTNLRELESVMQVLEDAGESSWTGEDGRGFIAPFRAQVKLSGSRLPNDFVRDTVHKFQGRECDEIVFSTVLDKSCHDEEMRGFVDNPCMVNVAVSRAKHHFTLVTGDDVFSAHNGSIAALVRYISYHADDDQIHRSPVVSAFDLLYTEHDQSLARLHARLRPEDSPFKSEQIVAQLLRDALSNPAARALTFHGQVPLNQVAACHNPALTDSERTFMANQASCDFVVYFKVGKTPVGVVEVDGGSHELPEQIRRDALKNSILEKCNIPLLRLRTVEGHIEDRLAAFLAQWASNAAGH